MVSLTLSHRKNLKCFQPTPDPNVCISFTVNDKLITHYNPFSISTGGTLELALEASAHRRRIIMCKLISVSTG